MEVHEENQLGTVVLSYGLNGEDGRLLVGLGNIVKSV